MSRISYLATVLGTAALLAICRAHAIDGTGELVYVGTHGSVSPPGAPPAADRTAGGSQGIYAARLDTATGHLTPLGLVAELQRATWLTMHPNLPVVYSVADSGGGFQTPSNIHSFAIDPASGKLRQLNVVSAGGNDATHLDLDVPSMTIFSANHGSGSVTSLPLQADGRLGAVASEQKDYGTGPTPRQKTPAAHGVAVDPTHHYVLVADFGADRVFVYRFDGASRTLTPAPTPFEAEPSGSGPRHLVFEPSGRFLFLDTEMTAEVRSYRWDAEAGRLHLVQAFSTYPADYQGEKSAAELAVSHDGRYLYVSQRGDQDSLIVYAVDQRSGTLREIQRLSSLGKTPWSFALDTTGRWMLVTNEGSNSVAVFGVDAGKLSPTSESLSIPHPVTVAFYAH